MSIIGMSFGISLSKQNVEGRLSTRVSKIRVVKMLVKPVPVRLHKL